MKTLGLGKIPRQVSGGGIKFHIGSVGSLAPAGGSFNIGFPTTIHHVSISPIGNAGTRSFLFPGTCTGAHYVKVNIAKTVVGTLGINPIARTLAKVPFNYVVWGE